MAVVSIYNWTCININSSKFASTQASQAQSMARTNDLHWEILHF